MEIRVEFSFSRGDESDSDYNDFEAEGDVLYAINEYAEEWCSDRNDDEDGDEEWELDGFEVTEYDSDFADPDEFDDLNAYASYAENVEEHGRAYHLRWEDIGDFDFHDQYNGEWGSEEAFTRDLYEQCYEIPDNLYGYIDWELVARDVMMDYSAYYDGSSGDYHIFRD